MNYQFTLTVPEVNLIMSALQEMPYREVANLIPKLGAQIQAHAQRELDEQKMKAEVNREGN